LKSPNGGVPRHLAMSIGFEYPQYPDAISKMIKDEQIKVTGCLRYGCESFNRGTPPLINMERSGMLINVHARCGIGTIPTKSEQINV
jgi:hypothetical protein